jgi:hypothetical protein
VGWGDDGCRLGRGGLAGGGGGERRLPEAFAGSGVVGDDHVITGL